MEEYVSEWFINSEKYNSYFSLAKKVTEFSSKLPKPIYKGLLYTIFPLFEIGGNLIRRITFNPLANKLSPKIGLTDDFSLKYDDGHFVSKKISIYSYLFGIWSTVTTAFHINQPNTVQKYNPKKYILDSQDFLVKNNKYMSHLFFKDYIDIYVNDNQVYINNRLLETCSPNEIENTMYQMLVMQQYITHVGIHFITTYGNNIFRKAKLHKNEDNPLLKILFVYLKEIRSVTDGHGKYDLMSFKSNNSLNLREQELYSVGTTLTSFYELLIQDLCENSTLVLDSTRKVYKVYQDYTRTCLSEDELQSMIDGVYENCLMLWSKEQMFNAICNCMFLVSYFHTKVHLNLQHVNLESIIVYGLLNQADLAMEKQRVNQQPILVELQNKIKEKCPGEENFVCNSHELL